MARLFEGSSVWITGGGSGIGRASALEFARQGANVAVSGRRVDKLASVVADVQALGVEAQAVACDVCSEASVSEAVDEVVRRFGKLDVALANAGFSVAGKVVDLTAEDWRRQLDTNVVGTALTARYALPHLRQTKGRFAMIGSVAGFICSPKLAAYNASKFAVRALGQTLAIELAGSGVSSTLIHPGFVDSEIAKVDNSGHYDASRDDKRPKRLMWPAERAARVVVKSIYRRKREVVFSGHGKVGAFLGQHLPGVAHVLMTRGK
jgi:NAD(P)-dependent dehydrogenase (short-subunit alcohol dehydrogenase family)